MAYDLRATLRLTDEFTRPIRNAMTSLDRLDRNVRDVERSWRTVDRSTRTASESVRRVGNAAGNSRADISRLEDEVTSLRRELQGAGDAGSEMSNRISSAGNVGRAAGTKMVGAFAAVATAIAGVISGAKIMEETIGGAAKFESSEVLIDAMFNDKKASAAYVKMVEDMAKKSPVLNSEDMYSNSKSFISLSKDAEQLKKAWGVVEKLNVLDPVQGVEGAVLALRELAGGDVISLAERFEMPKKALNELKKMSFEDQVAGMEKLLAGMNITDDVIKKMGNTTMSKWNQVQETIGVAMRGIGKTANTEIGKALGKFNSFLEGGALEKFAATGDRVLGKAFSGLIDGVEWSIVAFGRLREFSKVAGERVKDALKIAGVYLSDTFGPLLGKIQADLEIFWSSIKEYASGFNLDSLRTALDKIKTGLDGFKNGMNWISDNYESVKTGVMALTGATIAYNAALAGTLILGPINHLIRLYNTGMLVAATQVKLMAAAQWVLNAAMAAFPLNWIPLAIAAVVAAGILLWRNWDKISAKAKELWALVKVYWSTGVESVKTATTVGMQWISTKWNDGLTWISDKTSAGLQWISDKWNEGMSWLANKTTEGMQWISDSFNSGVEWVKTKWSDFTTFLADKAEEMKTSAIQKFQDFKTGVTSAVATAIDFIITRIKQLPETMAYNLGYTIGVTVEAFRQLPGLIGDILSTVYTTAVTKLKEIGRAFLFYSTLAVLGAVNWISQLPGRIQTFIVQTIAVIGIRLSEMATSFGEWFSRAYTNAITWIAKLPGRVLAFLVQVNTWARTKLMELATSFTVWFARAYTNATNWVSKLPGRVTALLETLKVKAVEKLVSIAAKFTEWFGTARTNAEDQVKEVPKSIAATLAEIPGKAKQALTDIWESFKALGAAIPEAIAAGFESAKAALGTAANWAIDKAVGGLDKVREFGAGVANAFSGGYGQGVQDVDGSHATGLARVKKNGYIAELHSGESVLTAKQSDILRGMGVLKASGDKPVLDASPLAGKRTGTGQTITRTSSTAPSITIGSIQVIGHNKPTKEITREILEELNSRIAGGALA